MKARETADKAKEIDPDNVEIEWIDAPLLEAEGKYPDAIKTLQGFWIRTAKKTYNAAEKSFRVQLLERLGVPYRSIEQFQPAVDAFRQMAEVDPDVAAGAEGRS